MEELKGSLVLENHPRDYVTVVGFLATRVLLVGVGLFAGLVRTKEVGAYVYAG